MKIELLVPDVPQLLAAPKPLTEPALFSQAYEHAASMLDHAQDAERNFAEGKGSLLEMTTARASADVVLSTAVAIASRVSQFASTLGNMSL